MFLTRGEVTSVAYSPCGKWIASGGDQTVRIWDAATGAPVGSPLRGHSEDNPECICFREEEEEDSDDEKLYYEKPFPRPECPVSGHSSCVQSVCFSPDGKQIASGSEDKTVKIWNASTGELQSTLRGHRYDPFPCIECLLL